jgi:hypothetical protein
LHCFHPAKVRISEQKAKKKRFFFYFFVINAYHLAPIPALIH